MPAGGAGRRDARSISTCGVGRQARALHAGRIARMERGPRPRKPECKNLPLFRSDIAVVILICSPGRIVADRLRESSAVPGEKLFPLAAGVAVRN